MKRSTELIKKAEEIIVCKKYQYPSLIKSGQGSRILDHDGRLFTDYCLNNGSLIIGHAHRNVSLAIKRAVNRGISFDTISKAEIDLAKFIIKSVASIERIQFTENLQKALVKAVRMARAFTKLQKVVVIGQISARPESLFNPGDVQRIRFNDIESLKGVIKDNPDQISCIIVSPINIDNGLIIPENNYLRELRDITQKNNILLIFDESVSGFRGGRYCSQGDFGVNPDLTCLAGIIGGGFTLGAVGGRKGVMETHLESEKGATRELPVNRVILRAGLAQMKLLGPGFYKALNSRIIGFVDRMNCFFEDRGIQAKLLSYASMFSVQFDEENEGSSYEDLHQYLLKNNIFGPSSGWGVYFTSCMHSKKDFDRLAEKLEQFFEKRQR